MSKVLHSIQNFSGSEIPPLMWLACASLALRIFKSRKYEPPTLKVPIKKQTHFDRPRSVKSSNSAVNPNYSESCCQPPNVKKNLEHLLLTLFTNFTEAGAEAVNALSSPHFPISHMNIIYIRVVTAIQVFLYNQFYPPGPTLFLHDSQPWCFD